ncbi:hypothetical protein ACSV5S_22400 [Agrobacterium deltaense]
MTAKDEHPFQIGNNRLREGIARLDRIFAPCTGRPMDEDRNHAH